MANFRKYAKRVAKKVGRVVKRRYFKGKGYSRPKIGQMVKDVAMLKKMVNAEKKRVVTTVQNATVAQLANATGSGHYIFDATPQPTQGTGYQNKTGNSIKWHSSHYDWQFFGQTNCISGIKLKIEWVKVVGLPYSTVNDIFGKYILPNPFMTGSTIYDVNSNRDPDYFKNFVVLKRQYITLRPDQITGDISQVQKSVGFKLRNHHVRTNDNDPTLTMGQVFCIVTADRGNWGTVGSTVTGGSTNGAQTGAIFSFIRTDYFYDN